MGNLTGYDANQHEPVSFDVLPADSYDAVITASELRPTKTGGEMLVLELQIINGKYQNRKVWDQLNLKNKSEKAVQIAKGTLSSICRAVGVMTPTDSTDLHNKPMRIKVSVRRAQGQYDEKNEVKSYLPRTTGPPTVQQVQPASPAPVDAEESPWEA